MEKLLVYAYFWWLNLNEGKEYNNYLDTLFLDDSNNDLLLDLELLTDAQSSFMRIKRYFDYEAKKFDIILFGRTLFSELGKIYYSKTIGIDLFAKKCYELYNILPVPVNNLKNPYHILSYIDDMLEFNGIRKTEEKIAEMLNYYN